MMTCRRLLYLTIVLYFQWSTASKSPERCSGERRMVRLRSCEVDSCSMAAARCDVSAPSGHLNLRNKFTPAEQRLEHLNIPVSSQRWCSRVTDPIGGSLRCRSRFREQPHQTYTRCRSPTISNIRICGLRLIQNIMFNLSKQLRYGISI